jgi:hypothetical protein
MNATMKIGTEFFVVFYKACPGFMSRAKMRLSMTAESKARAPIASQKNRLFRGDIVERGTVFSLGCLDQLKTIGRCSSGVA